MAHVLRSILGRRGPQPAAAARPLPSDIIPIGEAPDRAPVRVTGRIDDLAVRTHGTTAWLEASLHDGSGELVIVWMGRSAIAGIEVGRQLLVEGRLAKIGQQRRIYNPIYTLL